MRPSEDHKGLKLSFGLGGGWGVGALALHGVLLADDGGVADGDVDDDGTADADDGCDDDGDVIITMLALLRMIMMTMMVKVMMIMLLLLMAMIGD